MPPHISVPRRHSSGEEHPREDKFSEHHLRGLESSLCRWLPWPRLPQQDTLFSWTPGCERPGAEEACHGPSHALGRPARPPANFREGIESRGAARSAPAPTDMVRLWATCSAAKHVREGLELSLQGATAHEPRRDMVPPILGITSVLRGAVELTGHVRCPVPRNEGEGGEIQRHADLSGADLSGAKSLPHPALMAF